MPKVEVIETRDGSSSLFLPELDETYHSTHGAITESQYVFVEKALNHFISLYPQKKEINVLEIGFGTGLNPWLTALALSTSDCSVQFSSLEKFPLAMETIDQLNYTKEYAANDQLIFNQLHQAEWEMPVKITPQFTVEKLKTDISDYEPENGSFDIIYFDAFAPSKQPEMWQPEVLKKMYDALSPGGIFITYCAQGQFKRDLKLVGFDCEALDGPPGKKEMTRGIKPLKQT